MFRRLCSKVVQKSLEAEMMEDTVTTLYMLGKEFPLRLFNIMTHLMIHLIEELFICGPVHVPNGAVYEVCQGLCANKGTS